MMRLRRVLIYFLLICKLQSYSQFTECEECLKLGVIVDKDFDELPFRYAMEQYNKNLNSRHLQMQAYVDVISTRDAFKIARLVCNQFARGVHAMVASVNPDSFDTLHSYANTFHMPFITPGFPENAPNPTSGWMDYALSMKPDYHRAIIDLIQYYKWEKIIYLYDSHDGLLRLQEIFQTMPLARASFEVRIVHKVTSAHDALAFLKTLEKRERWSQKHVVLDSSSEIAKELIVSHVRDVSMGRRNYHYLLAGLAMDDRWDEDVQEYGAINITGFRIVDTTRPWVAEFLAEWSQLDPKIYKGAGPYISAKSALMYDAVKVTAEAINRALRKVNGVALNDRKPRTVCDLNAPEQEVWQHGAEIARQMRKVRFQGLTGNINFTNEGIRTDFSLDVVEMTVNSKTVKIGSWGDITGFLLQSPVYTYGEKAEPEKAKTYVITSILEKPFLMLKKEDPSHAGNDQFEGYCKDLADMLAQRLHFNYTIRLVKDNQYGRLSNGMWSGMIAELLRREADMAVAPLTITSSREKVVDFTKPFMITGISVMVKKPLQQDPGIFSFLSPLSSEIWMCVIFAYVGVSIVLFLVSRFSPYEWKVLDSYCKNSLTNDFTVCNSLWFSIGGVLQQAVDFCPRSLSGRIVSSVWWFFALILISSYTANLAALLTIQRLASPISTVDDLAKQTDIEYGMLENSATKEFFENTKVSVYSRMWDFMSSRKHVFVTSSEEGIERVRTSKGKYAFLLESGRSEYVNEHFPCDTTQVGETLNSIGYGIASPHGHPLRESLNMAVLQLKEEGKLDQLRTRWWFGGSECTNHDQEKKSNALTLSNVAGMFYILTGGLVLSLIVAFTEFCYKSKLDARRAKLCLSDALKAKAKMSVSGGKTVDNGRYYVPACQTLDGETSLHTNEHTQV